MSAKTNSTKTWIMVFIIWFVSRRRQLIWQRTLTWWYSGKWSRRQKWSENRNRPQTRRRHSKCGWPVSESVASVIGTVTIHYTTGCLAVLTSIADTVSFIMHELFTLWEDISMIDSLGRTCLYTMTLWDRTRHLPLPETRAFRMGPDSPTILKRVSRNTPIHPLWYISDWL